MFHANELPLRHLLAKINGRTVVPRNFSEPIGKVLVSCENLAVERFEITVNFNLDFEPSDLNTDRKGLYEILRLLSSGIVLDSLKKYHGYMSQARWLTSANRLLKLYFATGGIPLQNVFFFSR